MARLVAVTHEDAQTLYGLLARMSLTDDTPASLATRHAIAALSNQHAGKSVVAMWHQTKALGALQTAIERPVELSSALQMMAASLLLGMSEVRRPSTADGQVLGLTTCPPP